MVTMMTYAEMSHELVVYREAEHCSNLLALVVSVTRRNRRMSFYTLEKIGYTLWYCSRNQ